MRIEKAMVEVKIVYSNAEATHQLFIDGIAYEFDDVASNKLCGTSSCEGYGIFDPHFVQMVFQRGDRVEEVNFSDSWDVESFENPIAEVVQRLDLVDKAFGLRYEDREEWIGFVPSRKWDE
jgi:hypothetical protein